MDSQTHAFHTRCTPGLFDCPVLTHDCRRCPVVQEVLDGQLAKVEADCANLEEQLATANARIAALETQLRMAQAELTAAKEAGSAEDRERATRAEKEAADNKEKALKALEEARATAAEDAARIKVCHTDS